MVKYFQDAPSFDGWCDKSGGHVRDISWTEWFAWYEISAWEIDITFSRGHSVENTRVV